MSVSRRGFLGGLGASVLAAGSADADPHIEHSYFQIPDQRAGLLLDTTLCVGCRSCEAACKDVNDLPPLEKPIGDMSVFDRERRTTDTELFRLLLYH